MVLDLRQCFHDIFEVDVVLPGLLAPSIMIDIVSEVGFKLSQLFVYDLQRILRDSISNNSQDQEIVVELDAGRVRLGLGLRQLG